MKDQETTTLRNVTVIGHGHSGKTSLVEALLFSAGQVGRLGSTAAGSATTDFGEDEHARKLSIRLGLAHLLHDGAKVNLIDTPGFANFLYDARVGLSVGDTALVVVDAVHGIEVQTERTWAHADDMAVPARVLVINKMDRENADFDRVAKSVADRFGRRCIPVQMPIGSAEKFGGVIDLVGMKAHLSAADGSAAVRVTSVPTEFAASAKKRREALVEMVAETNESLMEKFLESGDLAEADLRSGLAQAVATGQIVPVTCTSATKMVGLRALTHLLVESCPPPTVRGPRSSADGTQARRCDDAEPLAVQVFKTLLDPYAGRLSLVRVWSGTLKGESTLMNTSRDHDERLGQAIVLQGKERQEVAQLHAGDIGCLAKLRDTFTGNTLADKAHPIAFAPLPVPEPMMSYALDAKNQGDEDKLANALHKICEEDVVLRYRLDAQTKELIVSGAGDGHIEAVVSRIRERFKVDVVLHPPRVPYQATITHPASGSYRHKKQTGGAGQFAEVHMEIKPTARGAGFEFDTKRVHGGAISPNFFPSIEKGVRHVLGRGPLGGFHIVDVRAEVFDGKMHPVDSKDIAFQMAGRQLMKELMLQARPILLEPIMSVRVDVPLEAMGDVMGDLASRRGRVQGMEAEGHREVIRALVPLAEMLTYEGQLKSLTAGRGDFHMEFDHYDPVPMQIQERILTESKHVDEGDE